MKGTTFASYIRKKTKTNTNTLTDADLVIYANVVKDNISEAIVTEVDEDYFQMTLVRDLELDKREYTLPNDLLKHIKRISAQLDGTNWTVFDEFDLVSNRDALVTESNIRDAYTGKDPAIDITGRGIKLYTGDQIIAVTEGLEIEAMIYPSDLTTSSITSGVDLSVPNSNTEHALPRAVHKVWADMVIVEYKQSKDKPIPLTKREANLDIDLEKALDRLKKRNIDRSLIGSIPYNDGQNY